MNFDKPFKTYDEQLKKLQTDYQLTIVDWNAGINILKSLSYYDLVNGYKDYFMIGGVYKEGTTIDYLYAFLLFDKQIQNILFKYSQHVENNFKNNLAYTMSKNFGVSVVDYLNKNNFIADKKRQQKLKETIANIHKTISNKEDNPTKYYCEKHNHVPPWILFRNLTFNITIDLYSFLKDLEKREIYEEYFDSNKLTRIESLELMKSTITIIRRFRNKIAHNLKAISHIDMTHLNFKALKKVLPVSLTSNFKYANYNNNMYIMILCLILLIKDKSILKLFIKDLSIAFNTPKIPQITVDYMAISKLPNNFIDLVNQFYKTFK
jgi:abortive infection bacteriophage resistance protein